MHLMMRCFIKYEDGIIDDQDDVIIIIIKYIYVEKSLQVQG